MFCPNCATLSKNEQTACRKCGLNLGRIAEEISVQNPKRYKKRIPKLRFLFEILGFLFFVFAIFAAIAAYCYYIIYQMIYLHDKSYFSTGITVSGLVFASIVAVILFILAGLIEKRNRPSVSDEEEFPIQESKKEEVSIVEDTNSEKLNKVRAKDSSDVGFESDKIVEVESEKTEERKPIELQASTVFTEVETNEKQVEKEPRSIFAAEHLADVPTFESLKQKSDDQHEQIVEIPNSESIETVEILDLEPERID